MKLAANPGMGLIRALRFPAKMAVIGAVILVPLVWFTTSSLRESLRVAQETQARRDGMHLAAQALGVGLLTQRHRGLTSLALAGETSLDAQITQTRTELSEALTKLQQEIDSHPEYALAADWEPTRRALEDVAAGHIPLDIAANFRLHTELVDATRHWLLRADEATGLQRDPDPQVGGLLAISVSELLPWTESLGRLRGKGASLLRLGRSNEADRNRLHADAALLASTVDAVERATQALGRLHAPIPEGLDAALMRSRGFAARAGSAVAADTLVDADPVGYFREGTLAIDAAVHFGKAAAVQAQGLLEARTEQTRMNWILTLVLGGGAILVGPYLAYAFLRTSFNAIRVLQTSVTQLSAGDFAPMIRLRATDELYPVAESLERMTGQLSEMVSNIRSNSSMVAQAGLQLAADTQQLAQRTESQAASLEQTTASIQEMSQGVQGSAQRSQQVDQMAAKVRETAERGGELIAAAVQSTRNIQASSQQMHEIISAIEAIAFQTNILALNAAVEAARAGDQGRGFAVVATEVRALAQRSSESARQIKSLIVTSVENVEKGAAQIDHAHETFTQIVGGIRELADDVRLISASAREQGEGLAQITQAVQHMGELTQKNAQMVDSAFRSSSHLSKRASELSSAVAQFHLRQGSADEAVVLVQKAVALYRTRGAAALQEITRQGKEFADRDMYVFAFDRQGYYRAFAGKPDKVGTALRATPGVDGDKLVKDAFAQTEVGAGWVDYRFVNPQTGAVDQKSSYVEQVGADLLLGCGVYKSHGSSTERNALLHAQGGRQEQRERIAQVLGSPESTPSGAAAAPRRKHPSRESPQAA